MYIVFTNTGASIACPIRPYSEKSSLLLLVTHTTYCFYRFVLLPLVMPQIYDGAADPHLLLRVRVIALAFVPGPVVSPQLLYIRVCCYFNCISIISSSSSNHFVFVVVVAVAVATTC